MVKEVQILQDPATLFTHISFSSCKIDVPEQVWRKGQNEFRLKFLAPMVKGWVGLTRTYFWTLTNSYNN